MKNHEFQTVTENLFYLLDSFKETALTKQRALIENNMDSLDQCISAEERLLFEVQSLFKSRAAKFEKAPDSIKNLTRNSDNLKNNVPENGTQEEFFKLLKTERDTISQKVKAINLINEQNKYLTEQSRGFIKSLIGELVSSNNNKLLDRKA